MLWWLLFGDKRCGAVVWCWTLWRKPKCRPFAEPLRMWWKTIQMPRSRFEKQLPMTLGGLRVHLCQKLLIWPTMWWPSQRSCRWSGNDWMTMAKTGAMCTNLWCCWTTSSRRAVKRWPSSARRISMPSRHWPLFSLSLIHISEPTRPP